MVHQQIEEQEIVERYARNQLAPEERRAFEEHYFACEECFEKLQDAERFIAGVRHAVRKGLLDDSRRAAAPTRTWRAWMLPVLAVNACTAVALAMVTGWVFFSQIPALRQQLGQASAELRLQQEARAALEKQVAASNQVEANVPLVMLEATRDVQLSPNEVILPSGALRLVLWIEVSPGSSESYLLQVNTVDNRPVTALENLRPNSYGALAVSLPVEVLSAGDYRIKLSGQQPLPATLIGEYRLRIRRP